jgi:hypothetical protein
VFNENGASSRKKDERRSISDSSPDYCGDTAMASLTLVCASSSGGGFTATCVGAQRILEPKRLHAAWFRSLILKTYHVRASLYGLACIFQVLCQIVAFAIGDRGHSTDVQRDHRAEMKSVDG